jgi:transcriptional regulator of acetoin/glycerol metabolism/AraC-like DNA-binding protein
MVRLNRSAGSDRAAAQHAERAFSIAHGAGPAPNIEELSTSWLRSANRHGVDPADDAAPRILTPGELRDFRGSLDRLIFSAQDEIDRLYKVVRAAGYTILFCDTAGVAVEHRGETTEASQFEYWGTWLGGVWSEDLEGTNGIGTCIAEERPVTVHRSQHFRSRNMDLSCSGAPIFGVDGRLMAVLDVSAIDPARSEQAHALTGALTVNSARSIEERYFREHFRHAWIVAIAPLEDGASGLLLAVDGHQCIIGANRVARASLLLDDRRLQAGVSLWTIFDRNPELFRRKDNTDIAGRLVIAGSDDSRAVLVTPPDQGRWRSATDAALHARPRLDAIAALGKMAPAPPAHVHVHVGLSPGVMRRVQEHVEANLGQAIDLATLAGVAGLSIHHFARGFKQSTGVAPHHYLIQKRVERAGNMLAHTDLALSEIAYAVGFSDQSHLARHFRRALGITPGQFRWRNAAGA